MLTLWQKRLQLKRLNELYDICCEVYTLQLQQKVTRWQVYSMTYSSGNIKRQLQFFQKSAVLHV